MRRRTIHLLLTCWVAMIIVSSCATAPKPQKMADEDLLRMRVQEYWTCRMKLELDKCYQYESPLTREKVKLVAYINQYSRSIMKWEGYNIVDLWTSGDEGHVKLNVKYRYMIPGIQDKGVFGKVTGERWEKKNDQWYRLSEEVM